MFTRVRTHRFTSAALAVVAAAALIGCSGSSTETPATATKATPVSTTTAVPAPSVTAAATATPTPVATPAGPAALTVAQVTGAGTLVEAKGLTLYTFKNDTTAGKSACNGACATNWPPLLTNGTPTKGTGISGDLGTIKRDDGSTQVTYKGAPLYRFAADAAAGDAKGAAIANWAVALP